MGSKARLKTAKTGRSVSAFLAQQPAGRRAECARIAQIMQHATGAPPAMWGPGIVGFGSYHYRYASGREGEWMLTGFSPRARNLTVYIMAGFTRYAALLQKLGTFSTGKSCLYIRRLDDVDLDVLADLVQASVDHLRAQGSPAY